MNERIRELALQAKQYAEDEQNNPLKIYTLDCFNEKFALLIVRECLELTLGKDRKQLLDKGDLNGANLVQKDIIRVIKHFGVRE
jgi:hypothetical protein